jgi:hypothetical protein
MSLVNLTIQMDDYQKDVLVHIDDGIESNYSDDDIFYYYETFEEIVRNNAIDFEVLEIDGTGINEFI